MSYPALVELVEDHRGIYHSPALAEQTQRILTQWNSGMYCVPKEHLAELPQEIVRILSGEYAGVLIHINRNLDGDVASDGATIMFHGEMIQLRKIAEYDIKKSATGVFAGSVGKYTYTRTESEVEFSM